MSGYMREREPNKFRDRSPPKLTPPLQDSTNHSRPPYKAATTVQTSTRETAMDKDEALRNFTELTGVPVEVAVAMLERNQWDVELALEEFYNGATQRSRSATPVDSHAFTDRPEQGSNPPKSATRGPPPSKFKSFSQLVSETANDEDDEKNLYAGGGRGSALNVENPDEPRNLVQELMQKAERHEGHADRVAEEKEQQDKPASHFSGVGHALGDSSTPSRTIGRPVAAKPPKVNRHITFWNDGFQVGDGRLYRYDDPSNQKYLSDLNSGRAPLELLDVTVGQDVDVTVEKKTDEKFTPPKRKLGGFEGSGHRLGSPVTTDYTPSPQPVATPEPETKSEPVEEEPKGDAQVQVRLADGSRVVRRIMSTAPVQELYDFVTTQTSSNRAWSLNHAFPVKPIDNLTQTIKEAGLVNSVVVQRWA